jgi:hypothetical protein
MGDSSLTAVQNQISVTFASTTVKCDLTKVTGAIYMGTLTCPSLPNGTEGKCKSRSMSFTSSGPRGSYGTGNLLTQTCQAQGALPASRMLMRQLEEKREKDDKKMRLKAIQNISSFNFNNTVPFEL